MSIQSFNLNKMKKSNSLTNDLAESLRNKIISGDFKVGEKLPSSKRIEALAGVSRSVVRESIAQLKAEGLVESHKGSVFLSQKHRKVVLSK
ncbi:winged helix-turn-helix domain-containing protein [Colwellia sp. MSW7]|uniref:Winged helix-turn-helix domain-containing protein n=1 Tax=Colwellia maritima TaxID=2912588 RepID=A0ABS9X593_9GAMM|nr:winged helix-turn-helix domain-containing protein [Colwellia maritima]MCI2285394.1 winged helix-turn-helix domain-containing protein [Colwellia maritima]